MKIPMDCLICLALIGGFVVGIVSGVIMCWPFRTHHEPTFSQIENACRLFNPKYDNMDAEKKRSMRATAEDWLRAWEESV